MKLLYDKRDKKRIEDISLHPEDQIFMDDCEQKEFVIKFKVTNKNLANYVILGLLAKTHPKLNLGIDVIGLEEYYDYKKDIKKIKNKIKELQTEVETLKNKYMNEKKGLRLN